MTELPSGTVTFLFTDIEASTRLWQEHPEAMKGALARHDAIVDEAVVSHGGRVVKRMGDGVHAVFATPEDGVRAATAAQLALGREEWGPTGRLRVRMGLHTGTAQLRDGDYFGSVTNRAARLMATAHGDQILVSHATAELVGDAPLDPVTFMDLGEYELRDLARKIRVSQLCHPELEHAFPPLRTLDSFPGNLPLQTTGFVGRIRELIEVTDALDGARVVTLTGIGGVGKTRVALEVGADVLPNFPDGVWLCELAPVGEANAVLEAIAGSLSVQRQMGQSLEEALFVFLGSKQLLLIIDNCEHLLDPVARFVDQAVHRCAGVTVLATSREGLSLPGERIIALSSLGLPESGVAADLEAVMLSDSVVLFVDRASDARSGFELNEQNIGAIVQVCLRLDGIPLAIELAAARVQAMTPAEISSHLDDRFRLLSAGRRTSVERHQTLRRAIDWSYDLLSEDERRLLRRLAVFTGGCTLAAAETVGGGDDIAAFDVLEHLVGLVRRSLVIADPIGGQTRYRLLETIRQYAQDRLEEAGDADATRHRHATYYCELAGDAAPELRGSEQLVALARLEPEFGNLRAAFSWALDRGDLDVALPIVLSVGVFGTALGDTALGWAELAAVLPTIDAFPLGPALLAAAAWGAVMRGNIDQAQGYEARRRAAETTLGLAPDPANFVAPATIALYSGRVDEATEAAREWVALARAVGDNYQVVSGLTMLGASLLGDPEMARAVLVEAVDGARRLANPALLSWALVFLGAATADPVEAIEIHSEAVMVATMVENQSVVGTSSGAIASLQTQLGDGAQGLAGMADAIERVHRAGNTMSMAYCLWLLATSLTTLGRYEDAIVASAGSRRLRGDLRGDPAAEAELNATNSAALGDARYEELRRRGAAMTNDELVTFARLAADRDVET